MIRVLPAEVANRIAAGEVIERPASVVKELVENALDAGARRVRVEIEEGGAKLIRVTDDGCGMDPDDLGRCVLPHATSKITGTEDLFRIVTMGFRGEALPSIGSVSRLSITSRPKEAALGARLLVDGGRIGAVEPAGAPLGTTVEVQNLFFNVPARKQFLKQDRAEVAQIVEMLTRLALPDPGWALEFVNNGRRSLVAEEQEDRRARIAEFFGREVSDRLIAVEGSRGTAHLLAYVSPVDLVRPTARHQYLFLNGRAIRDRKLSFAIVEAYRGLIMPKDHPVTFLFLAVDPAEVDVNVHPAKAEVRFRDPDRLFSLVTHTLRRALDRDQAVHGLRLSADVQLAPTAPPVSSAGLVRETAAEGEAPFSDVTPRPPLAPSGDRAGRGGLGIPTIHPAPRRDDEPRPAALATSARPVRFLQVHRSYVVAETQDGLRIYDQHALHERKLFDELSARFRAGVAEDQLLLVPHVVDVSAADREAVLAQAAELARLGLRVEAFGATGIALHSLPAALRRADPARVIEAALSAINGGGAVDREHLLHDVIATIACKAAVKFNDALPEDEVRALLQYESAHPEARNCPHGRNTSLAVSLRELETQFQRKK